MSTIDEAEVGMSGLTIEVYRRLFRSLGPRHRNVDRWRYELGWRIEQAVVENYLAPERARLVTKEGHA